MLAENLIRPGTAKQLDFVTRIHSGLAWVGSSAMTADGLIVAPPGPTMHVLDADGNVQWILGDK